jgi:hypothetical protein
MGPYTDHFVLYLTWVLAKKVFNAINKHMFSGLNNAATNIAIYTFDLLALVVVRPMRDNFTTFSQTISAATNLVGVVAAALPFIVDKESVPAWLDSTFLIGVTTAGTMVMAAAALMNPLIMAPAFIANLVGFAPSAGSGNVGTVVSGLGGFLKKRFEMIGLGRTKAAAKRHLDEAVARKASLEAKGGDVEVEKMRRTQSIAHKGRALMKGKFHFSFERLEFDRYHNMWLVLEDGALVWYRIKKMAVDDFDHYDFEGSKQEGRVELTEQCSVQSCSSLETSHHHHHHGPTEGIILHAVNDAGKRDLRVMFIDKERRDVWLDKLQQVIDVFKGVESDGVVVTASLEYDSKSRDVALLVAAPGDGFDNAEPSPVKRAEVVNEDHLLQLTAIGTATTPVSFPEWVAGVSQRNFWRMHHVGSPLVWGDYLPQDEAPTSCEVLRYTYATSFSPRDSNAHSPAADTLRGTLGTFGHFAPPTPPPQMSHDRRLIQMAVARQWAVEGHYDPLSVRHWM